MYAAARGPASLLLVARASLLLEDEDLLERVPAVKHLGGLGDARRRTATARDDANIVVRRALLTSSLNETARVGQPRVGGSRAWIHDGGGGGRASRDRRFFIPGLATMDSDKYHDGAARPTSMDPEAGSVGPTRRRWAVLGAFSFLSGLNNFIWISFAPVRSATVGYYGVSGDAVDWLSMIFMAAYPIVFLPCSYYVEKDAASLQSGLRISALMNCVGAGLRWLSCAGHSFALVFCGQTICAAAQGFTLGAPPRLAALWFPEEGEH